MLTLLTAAAVVAASVIAALGVLLVLRRRWPSAKMREANDATSFYIIAAGTIYAVIIAFMLSSVWQDFQDAKVNAEQEANAVVNLFRLAGALSEAERGEIREAALDYARAVAGEEWEAMERAEISPRAAECAARLWRAVTQVEVRTASEQAVLHGMLAELTKLTERRRARHVQSSIHCLNFGVHDTLRY